MDESILREKIRNLIREMLTEMTSTGDVAGYLTPGAFRGNNEKNVSRMKKIATRHGYSLTNRGEEELSRKADTLQEQINTISKQLNEGISFNEYRKEFSESPHKKMAEVISNLNKELKEIQRVIGMNQRLKTEYGITSETLWKRTQKGLTKLEAKLLHIAGKIREIRGQ